MLQGGCREAARRPQGGREEAAGRLQGDYDTLAGPSLRSILCYFVLRNEVYRIYHAVGPEARRIFLLLIGHMRLKTHKS